MHAIKCVCVKILPYGRRMYIWCFYGYNTAHIAICHARPTCLFQSFNVWALVCRLAFIQIGKLHDISTDIVKAYMSTYTTENALAFFSNAAINSNQKNGDPHWVLNPSFMKYTANWLKNSDRSLIFRAWNLKQ